MIRIRESIFVDDHTLRHKSVIHIQADVFVDHHIFEYKSVINIRIREGVFVDYTYHIFEHKSVIHTRIREGVFADYHAFKHKFCDPLHTGVCADFNTFKHKSLTHMYMQVLNLGYIFMQVFLKFIMLFNIDL